MARKTQMQYIALDVGNYSIKAKSEGKESMFRHAIKELGGREYNQAVTRDTSQSDVYIVNGTPFAVGDTAIRHGFASRKSGAARYDPTYYGVFAAIALFKSYDRNMQNLLLYGSHAPQDVEYRQDIIASAQGQWSVECNGVERVFNVVQVNCIDEPVGGVRNRLINDDGTMTARSAIKNGETIVIDIGGFTTDIIVLEDGKPDYLSAQSDEIGIHMVVQDFEKELRANNRTKMKRVKRLDNRRLHEAIRTGVFDGGGLGDISCHMEADHACNVIVSQIRDLFDQYNGMAAHNIVITGGGAGLLESRLRDSLGHPNVLLADAKRDEVHMANVRGAMKTLKMLKRAGRIE